MVTQEKTGKSPCDTSKKTAVERDDQDADLDQRAERRDQEYGILNSVKATAL